VSDADKILTRLESERQDLAILEHDYLEARTLAFLHNRDAKTVKEMEYLGEFAALPLHKDLLLLRARVRSLEDRLTVELHNGARGS
jgi:hypothetical protein